MQSDVRRTRSASGRRGRTFAWLAAPTAALVAALAFSGPAGATSGPVGASPYVPAQMPGASTQIIMRDGGVCDPIRHMGC